MQIRRINTNEAKPFFNCLKNIDRETKFMMLEPDERHFDEKKMKEILGDKDDYFIAAINDGEIIGFLSAQRGKYKRTRHLAYIVIGIRQEFQKQGIGSKFFDKLEEWAKENHLKRLELTVEVTNSVAINLYKRLGFVIEGTKKNTMFVDGVFVDEYMMAKVY
jgi:hypothetical protein